MGDVGVTLASLILAQLIVAIAMVGVVVVTRIFRQRRSNANRRMAAAEPGPVRGDGSMGSVVRAYPSLVAVPISRFASDARGFRVEPSDPSREPLVRTPSLVSLPVDTLAGLPIRRPVMDGWSGSRKRGKGAVRRRVVRQIVSGACPACHDNEVQGRNYCRDCGRRLKAFLS
jgi:hypothetical protein